jgi:uncharacterized protein (TIGR04255 family)
MTGGPAALDLSEPPLREALVDLRVDHAADFDVSRLAVEPESLGMSSRKENRLFKADISPKATGGPPEVSIRGYFYFSEDELEIAQLRSDGFTFNRLAPYLGWEQMLPRAMHCWREFVRLGRPERVNRLALRYINQLDMGDGANLARWLRSPPSVSHSAPGELAAFFSSVTTIDEDSGMGANVIVTTEGTPGSGLGFLMVDLDVFSDSEVGRPAFDSIEEVLGTLREIKNRLFQEVLTPEALELYR